MVKQNREISKTEPSQILLTDKTPSLVFEADASIKLELEVKTKNLDLSKCDVIIDCKSSDGLGFFANKSKKETNFKEGILVIHAINQCCGSTMTIRLTAYEKNTDFVDFYPCLNKVAEAEIVVKPTCKKKVGAVTWDIKDNVASNVSLGSPIADVDIDLFGYNGRELLFIKNIIEKGKVVFERTTIVPVKKNSLKTQFYKSDCVTQTPDAEMTLAIQLFYKGEQIIFEDNTRTQKRDIKLQKYKGVEPITDFPIQPVKVGTRDIIDNTFSPFEIKEIKDSKDVKEEKSDTEKDVIITSNEDLGGIVDVVEVSNIAEDEDVKKESLTKKIKERVTIEILDDANNPVTENFIQFVNLPKDDKFINNEEIKWRYQLGANIKCRVTLNGNNKSDFKINLVAHLDDIIYSESEKSRNPRFNYREKPLDLESLVEENGVCEVKDDGVLFLSQAGGKRYYLSVTDNTGEIVAKSVEINTWRMFFFIEVRMKTLPFKINNQTNLKEEFKKHFVILKSLGSCRESITFMENVDNESDLTVLVRRVNRSLQSNRLYNTMRSYCTVLVNVNQQFIKRKTDLLTITTNIEEALIKDNEIIITLQKENNPEYEILWYNLGYNLKYDQGHNPKDLTNNWFISCVHISKEGQRNFLELRRLDPVVEESGICFSVAVYLKGLSREGKIELTVNTIQGSYVGQALYGTNIITISEKSWWEPVVLQDVTHIITHEIGHQIGMVPNHEIYPLALDKTSMYYDDDHNEGHSGPHCDTGTLEQKPSCVMYGLKISGNTSFCETCSKCIKKLDLSKIHHTIPSKH